MKVDNQKNGWKGVCVYQETNGDIIFCPVRALGRRYVHLRANGAMEKTILSAYYHEGKRFDVSANHVSLALKMAATALEYPILKGIPIDCINTHSLCSGRANALALAGISDMQIQKMGRWRGATFKEYVRNESHVFLRACLETCKKIKKIKNGFINVAGNSFSDITDICINTEYSAPLPMAVM